MSGLYSTAKVRIRQIAVTAVVVWTHDLVHLAGKESAMSRLPGFKRWIMACGVAGALAGGLLAVSGQAHAAALAKCTCSCTISGSGSYTCGSPNSCAAGSYTCDAHCVCQ